MLIFDKIFPSKCALCSDPSQLGFCDLCQQLLPWKNDYCDICASELTTPGICGACQARPPRYQKAIIPFHYQPPISEHIQKLKYHNQFYYAYCFSRIMANYIVSQSVELPQAIVPIPLHRRRIYTRGFNQVIEIAKGLSGELKIKVDTSILSREKNTTTQTGLSERDRIKNMEHAFRANEKTNYSHVAILDDVVTSGSTVNEAADTLIQAGVGKVSVWAIAKTEF